MRADITNIPISDVFEPKDGCPLCRLRDMLEERMITYITGAAMMEPDVRQETNRQGFCLDHYRQMLGKRNRLSVALMMQSHLDELEKQVFGGVMHKPVGKQAKNAAKTEESCFVCQKVDTSFRKMLENVCRLWEQERDFRTLFEEQPALCLPHFTKLTETASYAMGKKSGAEFQKACSTLAKATLGELKGDVAHFCSMFDYRNAGGDWGNSKDAVERTVWFLTGRKADE